MSTDLDKLIADVRRNLGTPQAATDKNGKLVVVQGAASKTMGTKKREAGTQINALGAGDYGASKKTKLDSTLNAAAYNAAGSVANLFGLLDELDARTKARDEADSARLKAGRDASEKGEDINTRAGGLKKQSEDSTKLFEKLYSELKGAGQKKFDTADKLMQRATEEQNAAKAGLGKLGQGAVDFGIAATQFAGDAVLNALLPGSGLAAMDLRAAGGGSYEARQEGLGLDKQLTTGMKSAAIEVLTEKLFGAGSKIAYGKGLIKNQNVVNGIVNRLAKTDKGRTALKVILAANEEGMEEVLSDILNPIADYALDLRGADGELLDELTFEQAAEDYIIGTLLGGMGSGGNVISGQYKAENTQQREKEKYQSALTEAAERAGTDVQKYKDIIENSGKRGKRTLNDKETAELENIVYSPYVELRLDALSGKSSPETAKAIIKAARGEKLTKAEQKAFDENPYSQRVVNEMTEEGTSNSWFAAMMNNVVYPEQRESFRPDATSAQQTLDRSAQTKDAVAAAVFPNRAAQQRTASEIIADLALGKTATDTQVNIDNTANTPYTDTMNGGAVNDGNRMDSGMVDGVSKRQWSGAEVQRFGELGRGNQELSRRNIISNLKAVLWQSGVVATELQNFDADSAAFSNALNAARAADAKNGWAVTPQSVEQLQGKQLYMDANGTIGFALTEDGDIEAVFKNGETNHTRHALDGVMPQAIALGGVKLDCYGERLAYLYENYGLIPVARAEFNDEVANPGWDESKGRPYVYFMIHNGDSAETVAANIGKYEHMSLDELENLPTFDKDGYDDACAYRDSLLDERQNSLPKGTGAAELGFTGEMTDTDRWVAEAQGAGDSAVHPVSDEQAASLAEQQQRAPQELPKLDPFGQLTSKTASTIMNSGITPDAMSNAILDDAAKGRFSRMAYSDSAAVNKAESEIENGEGRYQGALERWKRDVEKGKVSKDTMVMGICLYNNAVTNGDYVTAIDIASGIVDLGKNSAQAMQAVRLLNKLSPEGRIYVAAKAVDKINKEVKAKYGDKAPDISVDEELYSEYAAALEDGDKERIKAAWSAVEQNIADQIPANWADKLNAWRYLSMLGNVRTHVRNTVGNAGFMPVWMLKNMTSAALENAADVLINAGIERTKAVLTPKDKALIQLAWSDYENSVAEILSGGKYNNTFSGVEDKRTIFNAKPLEAARKANSAALNAEDSWFSRPAYAESLASWLKANGYDAQTFSDGTIPPEKLDAARAYAVKEAQKATYRDTNTFSKWVTSLKVKTQNEAFNNVANAVIEGVLPFKKTPANILVRAVEYSPMGLAKTLTFDSARLRKGDITAAEYIDNLSQGIVGTALVGLGALLAKMGLLSGGSGDDDKQAAFDKMRGKQDYAINIGDWSATLDWLAPESMPLFVGVELYNRLNADEDTPTSIGDVLNILGNITAPMLEMSMLQGVNEVLQGLDYSNSSALATVVTNAAGSLISQFFPTILGQAERAFTEGRQTTFVEKESNLSANTQRFIGNLANKIPGVDFQQIDYIDAWGRTEDTGSGFERFFNNMINPSYMKKSGETDVDSELQRLYDLGETAVFPQRAAQSTKINGKYLTADEYVSYAKERGSTSLKTVQKLIKSSAYKKMSDADKAEAIKNAYDYADSVAKKKINRNADVESWVAAAQDSGNAAQYIADKTIMRTVDTDGNGSYSNAEKVAGLISGGYSGAELVNKVRTYMTTESGKCELADLLERTQAVKVPDKVALDVYEFKSEARSDRDANGKVTTAAKEKVKAYINSLALSDQQKSTLYYSFYKK